MSTKALIIYNLSIQSLFLWELTSSQVSITFAYPKVIVTSTFSFLIYLGVVHCTFLACDQFCAPAKSFSGFIDLFIPF